MEAEENGNLLPFLDALVMRDVDKFSTTVYRKPTATGLYTRWDSYSDTSKKFALIRGRMARRSNQNSIRSSPSNRSIRSKSDGAGPGVRSTVMYGEHICARG